MRSPRPAFVVLALLLPLALPSAGAADLVPSSCVETAVSDIEVEACTPRVPCIHVPVGDGGFVRVCRASSGPTDADGDGFTPAQGDCDDADPNVYPGAPESPNGTDDDCDGQIDEGVGDADDDGYALPADCDDGDSNVNPGRSETPDRRDEDCDGLADEDFAPDHMDHDGDGVSMAAGDCHDMDGSVHPQAHEAPNGRDDDCDGLADEE